MAKLTRVTGKVFGSQASPTGDVDNGAYISQFGSAQAGTYVGTDDVAMIQNLPAWEQGWIGACVEEDQLPPLPERTGVDKVLSYQECYLLQQGMPEWDSATTYYIDNFCSYNGIIYKSLTDINLNNQPDVSPANWEVYGKVSLYTKFAINKGATLLLINNSNELAFNVDNANPLTYTNIMGETRTVDSLLSIDVSGTPYFYENFTKIGSPTINNGVVSGFSSSNYLQLNNTVNLGNNFEIVFKINLTSYTSSGVGNNIFSGKNNQYIIFYINSNGKLSFDIGNGSSWIISSSIGTTTIPLNTDYYVKLTYNGTSYISYSSTDGNTWTQESIEASSQIIPSFTGLIGVTRSLSEPLLGSIDLKESYININNNTWWSCMRSTSDGTYKVGLPHTGNQPYLFDKRIVIGEEYEYTYTNVATSANAISSASYSGQPNTYAFDGNTSTFWLTNNSGSSINNNDYIGQSGLTQKIAKIRVMQGDGYSNTDYCAHYKIQYSEDSGVTWNDIQEVTNGVNNAWQEVTLQNYNVTGTYSLRLLATQYSGTSSTNWGILELQFLVQDSVSIGDVWINPQELYTAKQFDGADWQDFNDVLLLDSSVTVTSGVITDLEQPRYNSNHIEPKFQNNPQIIETYINGSSGYRIWSDDYCVQWGNGTGAITLLKAYKDTNYSVTSYAVVSSKTTTGFSLGSSADWQAIGYIY